MADALVENKVVVKIFGEDYPITGTDDPAYISRVADYVDSKMREVARRARTEARDRVAILAALSIASELIERSDGLSSSEQEYESRLENLVARLDDVLQNDRASA
jgi:cell division protein ZapA